MSPDSTSMVAEVIMAEKKVLIFDSSNILDKNIKKQLAFLELDKQLAFWDVEKDIPIQFLLNNIHLKSHNLKLQKVLQKKINFFG